MYHKITYNLFQDQDSLGGGFDKNQAFFGGHIAKPVWVDGTMTSEEIWGLWLLGKYDGVNRVDPAALQMFGSVNTVYRATKRCGGRSFRKFLLVRFEVF